MRVQEEQEKEFQDLSDSLLQVKIGLHGCLLGYFSQRLSVAYFNTHILYLP